MIPLCGDQRAFTIPSAFSNEQASEPVHTDEQIISLDGRNPQRGVSRHAPSYRSYQSSEPLSPIQALPFEILSLIFQHANYRYYHFHAYHPSIRQALGLSSVSTHFRHVALGTPELWKRVPFYLTNAKSIGKVSALLQHCIALAPYINIFIRDELRQKDVWLATKMLLTSDTMRKIKAFALHGWTDSSNVWVEKLKCSSFPMLDTLSIDRGTALQSVNIEALKALTRLKISCPCPHLSITVPPSIQYLDVTMSPQRVISLLYQCPKLVELSSRTSMSDVFCSHQITFTEPIALEYLQRLTLSSLHAINTRSLMEKLRLPSLEYLQIDCEQESKFTEVISLCRHFSPILTGLIITTDSEKVCYNDVHQICRLPFHKLTTLEIRLVHLSSFRTVLRALASLDSECTRLERPYCPALKSISICYDEEMKPRTLLLLLKEQRIGQALDFYVKLSSICHHDRQWCPGLREEMRSIMGSRRVEVTWGRRKLHECQSCR